MGERRKSISAIRNILTLIGSFAFCIALWNIRIASLMGTSSRSAPRPSPSSTSSMSMVTGGEVDYDPSSRDVHPIMNENAIKATTTQKTDLTFGRRTMTRPEDVNDEGTAAMPPLFYHVSPGGTGSRNLFFAACRAGFPAVHYLSYCISPVDDTTRVAVSDDVVRGVLAHFELMRLYNTVVECLILTSENGSPRAFSSDRIHHHHFLVLTEDTSDDERRKMCDVRVGDWSINVVGRLRDVLDSGLVGLFDTPYPLLSPQVMQLSRELRGGSHDSVYVALTERDPSDWARNRIRNHEMLLCREEYSFDGLGSSEFDVIGCYERARSSSPMSSSDGDKRNDDGLHFWDVYRYRSPLDGSTTTTDVDVSEGSALHTGLMRQMKRHQEMYLPMARYAPDIFGVRRSSSAASDVKEVSDMAVDIRECIMGGGDDRGGGVRKGETRGEGDDGNDNPRISVRVAPFDFGNFDKLRPTWEEAYSRPLALKTCMGRIVKCLMS
ncbi:hypothetical protein ACHAXA_008802 [Cyclostephanos tholiformis]|uniref:Glycosyltransferase family 92 protein n=1 Tax=Cyclostephanos tholiformis TaxID=382380 RepID=A0ABD3R1Q0_9STRA